MKRQYANRIDLALEIIVGENELCNEEGSMAVSGSDADVASHCVVVATQCCWGLVVMFW